MIVEAPSPATRCTDPPVPTPGRRVNRWRLRLLLAALIVLGATAAGWILYQEMQTLKPLAQVFNCTVYYTPLESAFVPGKNFDLRPETRTGLSGISYPADFLKAVALEGFGRLKNPVQGKPYIFYNGKWGYAEFPLGNRSNVLQPGLSGAISTRNGKIPKGSWVVLRSKNLPLKIEARPWRIDDVGAGVGSSQIDLYWGEDAPAGPGPDLERPAGIEMTRVQNITVCLLPSDTLLLRFWTFLHRLPFPAFAMHVLNPLLDHALQHAAYPSGPEK